MKEYFLSRFMIGILFFTVSAQIIATFLVFDKEWDSHIYFSFLILGLVYLFFMRVVDDSIDAEHDAEHYAHRSLQKGKLSLKKLLITSLLLLGGVTLYFYFYYGNFALLCIALAVINTLMSIFSYGFSKNFRFDHIVVYHLLNSFGIGIIQILLYVALDIEIGLYPLLFFHFFLVFCNNFLLEVARKIKSKDEISHHDDYISALGKRGNTFLLFSLIVILVICNLYIVLLRSFSLGIGFIIYSIFSVWLIFLLVRYHNDTSKQNKKLFLLMVTLFYLYSFILFFFL